MLNAGAFNPMAGFPKATLAGLDQMTVACELDETQHKLQVLMRRYQVGAIVPFFFHSRIAASWLLLGEAFNKQINTPLDFKVVGQLFDKLAVLLLDQIFVVEVQSAESGLQLQRLKDSQGQIGEVVEKLFAKFFHQNEKEPADKSLDECLSEFEAVIIKQTLRRCRGNKAKAARLLGLRANTLHYKLERYDFVQRSKK
ncbi:MAG TPA: helix-turn-helix domain-containing protein [Acidiferrobacterales bacterium]|nr:helix-turn-helix domain-containing protein [Acidiferrobacterales bacterium]